MKIIFEFGTIKNVQPSKLYSRQYIHQNESSIETLFTTSPEVSTTMITKDDFLTLLQLDDDIR